jgi:hypothetical protein
MAKVKLSAIRAQFPMYADLSDDQLLSGVRQKFYADIPPARFAAMVDYDTQREALGREVTDEMGTGGRFLAGIGKGMTDIAQGVGQMVGLQSREDVRNKRRTDEALSNTTAGTVGGVVGAVAPMLPLALVPGANTYLGAAAIGGGTGLAAPSESTGETLQNLVLGGGAGAGGLALGRALGAGTRAVGGLMEPFTKAGQERIAARTLQQFATNPAQAAAALRQARPLVPGSNPTMAQASGDAGLAQLERTLVNNPETGSLLAEQFAAQRAARLGALQGVAGNAAKRDAAVAAREAATKPLYQQATAQTYAVDNALQGLLNRPAVKQAMERAGRLAANQGKAAPFSAGAKAADGPFLLSADGAPLVNLGAPGKPATITGGGLQDLKMALDDMLSDPMAGIGKNEAGAVKEVRSQLIDWMEGANPAFKQARTTFAEKSAPINTMDVAQALMNKLQPALARYGANTREQSQAYAQALEAAKETVKRQIGINRPMDEVIDQKAAEIFRNVAKDLGRKAAAEDAGRAVGSNTAQNLAAQNLLRRTLGPTGLPQSWAESNALQAFLSPLTGLAKLSGSEAATMQRLAAAAMDPADAASLLTLAQQPSRSGVAALNALRYVPVLPAAYSSQQ